MILDDIAVESKRRAARMKENGRSRQIHEQLAEYPVRNDFPFEKALLKKGLSFICEVKKASPSKGVISEDFPYLDIAAEYESGGADAISCLTEPVWFKGSIRYLQEMADRVHIPVLRKDFIVDPCQIEEAAVTGASAVLLIAAILTDQELGEFLALSHTLGLSVLAEAHDEEEVRRCLAAGARIIGVNNRNLKDFTVDLGTAERLRPLVPKDVLFVAESGMTSPYAVKRMEKAGADAVLIGEMLMRSHDRRSVLQELKQSHDKN